MLQTKTDWKKNGEQQLKIALEKAPAFFCPYIKGMCNPKCINSIKPRLVGEYYSLWDWSCNNINVIGVE